MSKLLTEVAKEFNIKTSIIIEYLRSQNFDITNNKWAIITPEMYDALIKRFEELKAFEQQLLADEALINALSPKYKVKTLIDVAEEFHLEINDLAHYLRKLNFEISNNPWDIVTPDMYRELVSIFGKSITIEQESRKNNIFKKEGQPKERRKRLHQVCLEFNLSYNTVVKYLKELNFDISHDAFFEITPKMYNALVQKYGNPNTTEQKIPQNDVLKEEQQSKNKMKLLHEVCIELNLAPYTIVEYLNMQNFDIRNEPLAKITPKMYNALVQKFGITNTTAQKVPQNDTQKKDVLPKDKIRQLYDTCITFNLPPKTIVDYLRSQNFQIINEPTTIITPEMYDILAKQFGDPNKKYTALKKFLDNQIITENPEIIATPPITESPKENPKLNTQTEQNNNIMDKDNEDKVSVSDAVAVKVEVSNTSETNTTTPKEVAPIKSIKIKNLEISNFKVFGKAQRFTLNGNDALVFGVNGSGKSSFSRALNYFLQSSTWTEEQIQTLFDADNEECIRNLYADENTPSYIKITTNDAANSSYTLQENDTSVDNDLIKNAYAASDFMDYNLLFQFYHFRSHQDSNIFSIIQQEFFPLWLNTTWGKTFQTRFQELQEKSNEFKRIKFAEGKIPSKKSMEIRTFQAEIDDFNDELDNKIQDLLQPTNEYLKIFLKNEHITVLFKYSVRLGLQDGDNYYEFNQPVVELCIKVNEQELKRPHAFLNEARLTALALSIRLSIFDQRLKESPLKILVLDDLLISLDMSNRMTIFQHFLFDKKYKEYQKIILTHDKALYDFLQKNIKIHISDGKGWIFYEFYENTTIKGGNPIIMDSQDSFAKAEEAFEKKNFEVSALFLRKYTEELVQIYFNPDMEELAKYKVLKQLANATDLSNLEKEFKQKAFNLFEKIICVREKDNKNKKTSFKPTDIDLLFGQTFEKPAAMEKEEFNKLVSLKQNTVEFIKAHYEHQIKKEDALAKLLQTGKQLDELRTRILNAGAHPSSDIPFFEWELKGAIATIKDFAEQILKIAQEDKDK
jgi:hypothetical protein